MSRSPYNAVGVELSDDTPGADRYEVARCRLDEWLASGLLLTDPEPGFYVYRMGHREPDGTMRQTSGVLGALELSPLGSGGVLPHERTLPKAKDDRLRLLRACRANLSPIWGLSMSPGLSALCEPSGPPLARCTDDDGVHHRLWRLTQPAVVDAVRRAVASSSVVIADGHHRYETALAYQAEQREAGGGRAGDHDFVLTYVVELARDQLSVGPIHRALSGLPEPFDPLQALAPWFEAVAQVPVDDALAEMAAAGTMALVTPAGATLVRRSAADGAEADEPDAVRLDAALAAWPPHEVTFQHAAEAVAEWVAAGKAELGFLLRPATVDQIADAARAGRRLPEKTTFFRPKPATGLVFRRLTA
jgi:uncharacterized protein (DUF1015 family)